ncbi:MAG: autotransporter-associated beta strand repeat-containing protein, partial [Lentimicrobiaceae bacterium]|nr:autotransporter-associated beta strand repeat-containing protein [Lentimicrobiaceae bacterium]
MKHFNKFLILLALIGLSAGAFAQTALPQSGNLNGQYTATPGSSYSSPYNLTGTTIIWVNSGTATITGEISGSSSYVFGKEGAGTLILTGTNTYNGQTGISGGKLQVGNGTSGSINNTSGVQISTTSATLRFEPFGSVMTFDKVISGSGKVEKAGATCDLRFTKDHLYTGTTTVESGQLSIGYTTTTGSVTGDIIVNSGAVVYFSRSNDYTYSGVISGAGSVYKSYASSKLILTGVNTYTGLTRINGGTLQIGNGSTGSIANTSTVDFFYNPPDATLRFEPGADMVFSKVISGSGKVEYKGAEGGLLQKTLSFTAKNTYTGTTTIEQGYFQIGANSNSGEVAGDIILQGNHSHLCFSRTDSYTYAKNITGTGYSVDVNTWEQGNSYYTNGTVILTGNNTYTGKTRIYSGILQVGNGSSGSINNTSDVSLSGANSTLCFLPGGGMIFSKVITGNGKVEIKGPNNIYFTADNDYEGTTTIDPGVTLSIGNDTSTGAIAG